MRSRRFSLVALALPLLFLGCTATPVSRGTGDLGVIVERASGSLQLIDTSARASIGTVPGLGDLSHASVVYTRDGRYAFVFGRDGGLTKIDLLAARIERRIVQSGNSIGGAISQDGRLVAAANYDPGGIKVFDADTLQLVADIPAAYGSGNARSKVVGLADAPGNRFVFSLFDADELWVVDLADPAAPRVQKHAGVGRAPYDGLVTPDGRYYLAGLFGEDGVALLDLWKPELGVRRILADYGQRDQKLPVYKMPHLRGWAIANGRAYLPGVGRHEVLVVDIATWREIARIPVQGQPIFVMARPDGRQIWVNFAFPANSVVQIIDALSNEVMQTLQPGRAVLHMEFTPRGEAVWISARDDHRVVVYDTRSLEPIATLPAANPSGIFFTARATRIGF
jgi:protein NirF